MLSGIAAYHRAEAEVGSVPLYRLRRSIHRIEKGLIASPRRPVFAEGYVNETVDAYARLVTHLRSTGRPPGEDGLLVWATDVLNEYFASAGSSDIVDAARDRFVSLAVVADGFAGGQRAPRVKANGPSPVDPDDLLALASRRRSVRRFEDRSVSREVLDRAMQVARQSPSACNRQAFRFRLYDDPALAAAVARIAPGFDSGDRVPPVMAVVTGLYRAYYRERDQHVIYIDASLATMALVLSLEAQGLGSCCINWPSLPKVDAEMEELLGLDPDEEVVMCLAIGYADPEHRSPYSQKADLDELRVFNHLGTGATAHPSDR